MMKGLRLFTPCLAAFLVAGLFATAHAGVIAFSSGRDFRTDLAGSSLEPQWQGFNRVKSVLNGGQRSFVDTPLHLGDFSLAMVADEGVRVPRAKITKDGRRLGVNRVTRHPWLRVNKTKFARVKIKNGVDLVLTFDNPIYAFGAKFRGLNDPTADVSISLGGLTGVELAGDSIPVELAPPKASGYKRRSFFGFVSDVAFTTITFHGRDLFGMDTLLYAGGSAVPALEPTFVESLTTEVLGPTLQNGEPNGVPIPGTLAMLGLGLLSLRVARRR